jgi:antitoxin component YwqK of YwqJK toxin-antitoxin module
MKKIVLAACFMIASIVQAQNVKPTYEEVGDLVKATYYHEDGTVFRQGFFKDQKLSGKWTEFDRKGNKVTVGYYQKGKKVGTWFHWRGDMLRQVNYENNSITSVNTWREDTKVAVNK